MSARIAVHGATGRLGRLVMAELAESAAPGLPVPREGALPDCDVVIDLSSPAGTAALLPRLRGEALLVGTTGTLPEAALADYAARAPVAIVANFSIGVPLLLDLITAAVGRLPEGWQIEVVEAHHAAKKDAPSGTALRILRAIGERPDGAPVPTHALRVGDTVGEHTVWLAGPGERIELKHVATRREVFAIGALRHARWLLQQPPGLYRP